MTAAVFPSVDLVPKKETNTLDFLKAHPEYNGNNVLIGILDTGIDPGANGISKMEDGVTSKLLDIVDCTGSGDVDVSTIRQTVDPGKTCAYYEVESLSGRTIRLLKSWWKYGIVSDQEEVSPPITTPPTVQLGLKLAYELLPLSVINRVKADRQKKFDKELQSYIVKVRKELSDWQRAHNNSPTPDELRERDELQARLDVLTDKEWESENDPGFILDCIVFFDGKDNRTVVGISNRDDDSENDEDALDWTDRQPLAAFHKERRYDTISSVDQYNYGVNFYDNAQVLSIVGDCSPHGTHVASIAAAAEGERSGVAPGAQLISIKIGDSRMGSMESGSSIARGIMAAVRLGCDVINLSYGEASQLPNEGRLIRMAEELVRRHNIVFVSAVGNNGPALTTVNAPGGISSCIIGVAAYVSPDMMEANYSLENNSDSTDALVGTTYTWSSVGPTQDGDNGVAICAPGGAITSVSNWTLQKSMLMNGTSMASPHACGCIALLLSACKAEGIPITPPRIRRAVENSAKFMPQLSYLQQGWGMLQVDKAFDHLVATKDYDSEDVHFQVYLEGRSGNPRGIYLRQQHESTSKQVFAVRINPNFRMTDQLDDDTQKPRIDFEMKFALKSTAPSWVSTPDHFMLMNNGRAFKVSVDASSLSHGVHTAKVCGYDAENLQRGVIWSLPVTVVKPMTEQQRFDLSHLSFEATEIKRFFITPPSGATWMDVTVHDGRDPSSEATSRLFVLHAVQLVPHAAYRDNAQQKYLNLLPMQTSVTSVAVEAGITCEIDIGRYWSASGPTKADVTIEFRGVQPIPRTVTMNNGDGFASVRVSSDLKDETINPSAKFTKWKTPLRPKTEGIISPLGDRDVHPWNEKKTYQLLLTYEFNQDEKGAFTPRVPLLQEVLYESTYESQLILAYDGDKKYLGCCDAYAKSITGPKGTIVLQLQVRHDNSSMLEKLKEMTIWIEHKMEKEVTVAAYPTREDVLIGGKRTMKRRTLRKGTCASVFFSEPPTSKLPSSCKAGDVLMGICTYASGEASLPGDGKRPDGFPIMYFVGPKMDKPSSSDGEANEPKDGRTADERLRDSIRDLKVNQLDKLTKEEKNGGKFEEIYSEIVKEYPGHVPLLMSNLKYLDGLETRKDNLTRIAEAADEVISKIPEDELALHFGKKQDKDDPEIAKNIKEMEKKRSNLIEALVRKALALAGTSADDAISKFDQTLADLKSWVDIDANGKYIALALERDCRAGHHGMALKKINKLLAKNGKDTGGVKPLTKSDLLEKRAAIFREIGYMALYRRDKANKFVASPVDYKIF